MFNEDVEYKDTLYSPEGLLLYINKPLIEELRSFGYDIYYQVFGHFYAQIFRDPRLSEVEFAFNKFYYDLAENYQYLGYPFSKMNQAHWLHFIRDLGRLLGLYIHTQPSIKTGKISPPQYNINSKYITYEQLKENCDYWKSINLKISLVHGSFDPPTVGHAYLISDFRHRVEFDSQKHTKTIVGFDLPTIVKARKSSEGDIRPRFKQLAWKMLEMATVNSIDAIFAMPITDPEEISNEKYIEVYGELGVDFLGCSAGHSLRQSYESAMQDVGGRVVPMPYVYASSTNLYDSSANLWGGYLCDFYQNYGTSMEQKARDMGYLSDYPEL